MPTMNITVMAARNLITARNPDMSVEVAMKVLEEAALTAELLDERTASGELLYRVADLGGRLIVKDSDPDYGLVAVAFARDKRKRPKPVEASDIEAAKETIRASVEEEKRRRGE